MNDREPGGGPRKNYRLLPSDARYDNMNAIAQLIAVAKNPFLHIFGSPLQRLFVLGEVSEHAEDVIKLLEEAQQELMDERDIEE